MTRRMFFLVSKLANKFCFCMWRKTVKLLTHGGDLLELCHEFRLPFVSWLIANQVLDIEWMALFLLLLSANFLFMVTWTNMIPCYVCCQLIFGLWSIGSIWTYVIFVFHVLKNLKICLHIIMNAQSNKSLIWLEKCYIENSLYHHFIIHCHS